MLNAGCSPRSGKSVGLQKLSAGCTPRCGEAAPALATSLLGSLLGEFALELARLEAELVLARLEQPIVEPADMLDRAQTVRRHAQLDAGAERVRDERDVLQVGQERPLGL